MNKDKNWLLREVANLPYVLERGFKKVKLVDIFPLIHQLEKPEVLSQEWIDNNVVHVRGLGDIFEAETVGNLLPPEQELPVIPQFVADWWEHSNDWVGMYGRESINKKSKLHLISEFHDRGLGDHLSKVEDWLDENDSIFLDLVNGRPYEVEKEKLYYIKFSENQYAQKFDGTKFDSMLINDESLAGKFTKDDIKKMNPNLMALAVEVDVEVEE